MPGRAPYRRTFFDRRGPDGANTLRAFGFGAMVFGLCVPMFGLLFGNLLVTLALSLAAGFASAWIGLGTGKVSGDVSQHIYMGGNATAYEEQYSQEQALVMQRRVDEALALYEHRIALEPENAAARLRAADLYAGEGANPARAAELFREVQRIPGVAAKDGVYACNRLADLYLGPLREPGRAIVELRKLIDLYPSTPGAAQARIALAELKARLHAGSDTPTT
ncbi:MAG TPA: hypothetical protein VGD77_02090 [Gemmatimonadaceae bacterium]